VPADEKV
jgi:hypothetical protein